MPHILDRLDATRNTIAKSEINLKQTAFMLFMDMIILYALLSGVRISKSMQRNINHVTRTMDNVRCSVPYIKEVVQMPQNEWIKGALLIPENNSYKVDGSGRIVIPSYLRSKFRIEAGDQLEYFTSFIDDSWFLCVRLDAKTQAERAIAAIEEAAAALEEVRNEENI